jgi:hypothetical protein
MADVSRRDVLTRWVPGRPAPAPPRGDVSGRDLHRMSRAEVGEALRRIRARWRTRR